MKNLWQIAAGEPHRYYEELFFEYGIMILGPSHKGPANIKPFPYERGKTIHEANQLDLFANTVKSGDRVLLRKKFAKQGSVIIGIGIVRGDYFFEKQFECIHGWDLCHVWYVDWIRDANILATIPNPFAKIKRGPAFSRSLNNINTKAVVASLDEAVFSVDRKQIPTKLSFPLSDSEILNRFREEKMSIGKAQKVLDALKHCREMSVWYRHKQKNNRPTEHEVISHMILPLLQALGWDFKRLGVEWRRADIALFENERSREEDCISIIEAKGLGAALGDVLKQAKTYAEQYKNTRQVVVTDGANIYMYERNPSGVGFPEKPTGYVNMEYISENYVVPEGTSAIKTLLKMQPPGSYEV